MIMTVDYEDLRYIEKRFNELYSLIDKDKNQAKAICEVMALYVARLRGYDGD